MLSSQSMIQLSAKMKEICNGGYDLYFLHGWVTSALTAPNEMDEDDMTPTYLLFQHPEKMFEVDNLEAFMQDLNDFCNQIVEDTLSSNDPIIPLVNLTQSPVDLNKLNPDEERNLLSWVYGYLFSYLANWDNVADYCDDADTIGNLFFVPLLHLSAVFFTLDKKYDLSKGLNEDAASDYADLKLDLYDLWNDDENGNLLSDEKLAQFAESGELFIGEVGNSTSMLLNFVLDYCMNDNTSDDHTLN